MFIYNRAKNHSCGKTVLFVKLHQPFLLRKSRFFGHEKQELCCFIDTLHIQTIQLKRYQM